MPSTANPNLMSVDWSKIPAPVDDGATNHLAGTQIPRDITLAATDGTHVALGTLPGRVVIFSYPRTGRPGAPALVDNWDEIPGARGCTPQTCSFRDLHAELQAAGVSRVFGLSTQDPDYQREAADRLHLPFPLLSDANLELTRALKLPTHEIAGVTLTKRFAMVLDDGTITKVFYPVFPPDENASRVLAWLREAPQK